MERSEDGQEQLSTGKCQEVGRGAVLRLLSSTGRIQPKFGAGRRVQRAGGASLAVVFLVEMSRAWERPVRCEAGGGTGGVLRN